MRFQTIGYSDESPSMKEVKKDLRKHRKDKIQFDSVFAVLVLTIVVCKIFMSQSEDGTLSLGQARVYAITMVVSIVLIISFIPRRVEYGKINKIYKAKKKRMKEKVIVEILEDEQVNIYENNTLYHHMDSIVNYKYNYRIKVMTIEGYSEQRGTVNYDVDFEIENFLVLKEVLSTFTRIENARKKHNDFFEIIMNKATSQNQILEMIEKMNFIVPIEYHFDHLLEDTLTMFQSEGTQIVFKAVEQDGLYIPVYTEYGLLKPNYTQGLELSFVVIRKRIRAYHNHYTKTDSSFFNGGLKIKGIVINPGQENIRIEID